MCTDLEAKRKQAARKQDIGGGWLRSRGSRLLQPELMTYPGQSVPYLKELRGVKANKVRMDPLVGERVVSSAQVSITLRTGWTMPGLLEKS